MEKENLSYADVEKETGVSYGTIKAYAEKVPAGKWRDSIAVKFGGWVNQYEQKYREKEAKAQAKKLEEEAERNAAEQRKNTVYARAKMVHAIISSPVLTEQEKEERVSQYMQ